MEFEKGGWGGRIRTYGTRYQKALPYRLATPQSESLFTCLLYTSDAADE